MGIKLQNIYMLNLLWVLPALIAFYVYARQRRKKALDRFIDAGILKRINISINPVKRFWKSVLALLAIVLIIIGMTRPGWNPHTETIERSGRDVVFALDVSKSMLAEDLVPNRLSRAKYAIMDCLEQIPGDRVALVVFAGNAAVKCPLTLDYGFFRLMLEDAGNGSIARGGTRIGEALGKAVNEVFDNRQKDTKDIILITDGEDHDSQPIEAAKKAGEMGVRIIAIGLGDETEGRRIPVTDEKGHKTFLKYKGQEVWSRLDADTLRRVVNATSGGHYLNVSTGSIDLGNVYMKLVSSEEKKKHKSETIKRYEERYQIFLAIAFILLCLETIMDDRKQGRDLDA